MVMGNSSGTLDKSLDSGIAANRAFVVNDLAGRRVTTPVPLIAAAQALTGAWADLGPEISAEGSTRVSLWVSTTHTDGYNVSFRLLAKHTSGGADEYLMPIYKPNTGTTPYNVTTEGEFIQLNTDVNQKIILTWDISNTIAFLQFQTMEEGTLGVADQIASAYVTYGWGT